MTLISGLDVRKENPITMHNDMLKHHFRYHNRIVQNPNRLNIDGLRELFRGEDLDDCDPLKEEFNEIPAGCGISTKPLWLGITGLIIELIVLMIIEKKAG